MGIVTRILILPQKEEEGEGHRTLIWDSSFDVLFPSPSCKGSWGMLSRKYRLSERVLHDAASTRSHSTITG